MKNITTTILLVLVSLLSYSQEYYRDTIIERAVFNEVNKHRDSLGLHKVRFNPDNERAVPFGEKLVNEDLGSLGMEDIHMTRGFNSVHIFKSTRYQGRYVALSVFQFLRDKSHYTNLNWDENKRVPNAFL